MRRRFALLFGGLLIVVLAGIAWQAWAQRDNLFPYVPRHPGAVAVDRISEQEAAMEVPDMASADILAWYTERLTALGWEAVSTPHPEELMRLFTRKGRYLSLVSREAPRGFANVWFHWRATPEVTAEEARRIADRAVPSPLPWTAEYIPDFLVSPFGGSYRHPVWMLRPEGEGATRDVRYVDAITGIAFSADNR